MIYLYLSGKNYREQNEVVCKQLSIKITEKKDISVIVEEVKKDTYYCIGNLSIKDDIRRNEISNIVSKVLAKIKKIKLKDEEFVIIVHHDIISDVKRNKFLYCSGKLSEEGKLLEKLGWKPPFCRKEIENKEEYKEVFNVCNKFKESNIKTCNPGKAKILIVIISDEFGTTTSDWKAKVIDDWQLEACTEDNGAISKMIERVKELNKATFIFSHETVKKKIEDKIQSEGLRSGIWIIKGFRHMEGDQFYVAIKKQDVKKLIGLVLLQLFSLLKHRITHLWLPLDIDLQGMREVYGEVKKGKRDIKDVEDYFKEAFAQTNKLQEKCKEMKKFIEGDRNSGDKAIRKGIKGIMTEIIEESPEVETELKKITELINAPILNKLEETTRPGKFDEFRKKFLKETENAFHFWFCTLDVYLNELRNKLPTEK